MCKILVAVILSALLVVVPTQFAEAAQPAPINTTTAVATTGTTLSIAAPTGMTSGVTVMIAAIAATINTPAPTITPPTGWTQFAHQSNGATGLKYVEVWWYWKVYNSGDTVPYAWSFSNNNADYSGEITGWSNTNTTAPIDVSGAAFSAVDQNSAVAPSVTPVGGGGALGLTWVCGDNPKPVTPPTTGLTALHTQLLPGSSTQDDSYQNAAVSAGVATSTYSATVTAGTWVAGSYVIKPAVAASSSVGGVILPN